MRASFLVLHVFMWDNEHLIRLALNASLGLRPCAIHLPLKGTSKNYTLPQTCTSENLVKQGFLNEYKSRKQGFSKSPKGEGKGYGCRVLQKPSPLGVRALGKQSSGLFLARTGRQAAGTVAASLDADG